MSTEGVERVRPRDNIVQLLRQRHEVAIVIDGLAIPNRDKLTRISLGQLNAMRRPERSPLVGPRACRVEGRSVGDRDGYRESSRALRARLAQAVPTPYVTSACCKNLTGTQERQTEESTDWRSPGGRLLGRGGAADPIRPVAGSITPAELPSVQRFQDQRIVEPVGRVSLEDRQAPGQP